MAVLSPDDPLLAFTHALPKVELHCHLLGTVRRDTFTDLVRRAGAPISDAEIESFYTRGEKPVGVLRVLRALDAQLIRSADDLHRLSYEYLQDAAAHNVRYAEFFWNPTGTARASGIAYPAALAAIVRAIADAQQDHGITGRLIAAIDREAEPQAALEMVFRVRHRALHRNDAICISAQRSWMRRCWLQTRVDMYCWAATTGGVN